MPAPPSSPAFRTRASAAAAIAVVLVALAIAWTVTPLSHLLDPRGLAAYEQQVRAWPMAPLVVIAFHVVAGLMGAPGTLVIGATVLLFGVWPGTLYAFAGMMVNGSVVYAIGRFGARGTVDHWLAKRGGSRLDNLNRLLARRGFVAVALVRLTPIPYSVQNVITGASRIGFADFILGTSIGILPVITVMAGLASEFDAWLAEPAWGRLFALIGVAVAVLVIAWSLRRWAMRKSIGR